MNARNARRLAALEASRVSRGRIYSAIAYGEDPGHLYVHNERGYPRLRLPEAEAYRRFGGPPVYVVELLGSSAPN